MGTHGRRRRRRRHRQLRRLAQPGHGLRLRHSRPLRVWRPCQPRARRRQHVQHRGFIGSPYADWIDAGPGSQTVTGGRGWDTIRGGKGTDTILGGPGNDHFYAADHTVDHINGGLGVDHAHADATDKLVSATDTNLALLDPCNG
jgi:hypothetical protein